MTLDQQKKALEWYQAHREHVEKLARSAERLYAPTLGEDIRRPELWKAEHWKWFLKMYKL